MPSPKKTVAKKVPAKKADTYTVKLTHAGKTYNAQAETVLDALANLKMPTVVRSKTVITVERGGVIRTRILPPFVVSRLFSPSRLTREVALKSVSILFGGL